MLAVGTLGPQSTYKMTWSILDLYIFWFDLCSKLSLFLSHSLYLEKNDKNINFINNVYEKIPCTLNNVINFSEKLISVCEKLLLCWKMNNNDNPANSNTNMICFSELFIF